MPVERAHGRTARARARDDGLGEKALVFVRGESRNEWWWDSPETDSCRRCSYSKSGLNEAAMQCMKMMKGRDRWDLSSRARCTCRAGGQSRRAVHITSNSARHRRQNVKADVLPHRSLKQLAKLLHQHLAQPHTLPLHHSSHPHKLQSALTRPVRISLEPTPVEECLHISPPARRTRV